MAAPLGRGRHVPDRQRRPPPAVLRAVHVPLPVGAGPPGPRPQLHLRRPGRSLPDHAGLRRPQPLRVRLLRAAGGERRHQDGDPPPHLHRGPDRRAEVVLTRLGAVYDWRREVRSHDPAYMRWNQIIFLRLSEAGLAYRADGPGQLVSRAARPCSPTSRSSPTAPASARATSSSERDLEQWFFRITAVRRRAPGRPRRPRLARAGEGHAAQLDRALRGGRVRPRRRGHARARPCGSSPPGPTPASA